METKHAESRTHEVVVVDDVLCNKCGKSTKNGKDFIFFEGTRLTASFGYGSNKDGILEWFDICDKCYDEFVDTFIHKPEME